MAKEPKGESFEESKARRALSPAEEAGLAQANAQYAANREADRRADAEAARQDNAPLN